MFNSARAPRGQSSPSTPIDAVPAELALRPTKARALASRLNDINVCVTSERRLPRHFGQGALFWRADNMQSPSALKRVFLPGKDDADSFSKLAEKYDPVAVEAYESARTKAKHFAQNCDGVDQLNKYISQDRLASVRDQLTKALTHDAKFAEAWVLLARTLRRNDSEILLAGKQVPAGFIRSLAAVMADPYDPHLIRQLLSDLPAEENLPEFLTQAEDSGRNLPLTKARLALYTLKYLDPGYAAALSALIESGEGVQMSQLMPMHGELGATRVSSSELGAIALTGLSWLEGFFSLRVSRDGVSGNDQRFALGGGAYVTPEQLEILITLETEELDSNTGPAFDRESGEALLDRDRARAKLLDELADTLAGPDSWFYVPDYMLMTKRQLRAMANVFRAEPGAFDGLQRAIDAPVPPKVLAHPVADSSDQSGSDHSQSDDDSLSERSLGERSLGGMSWGDLTDAPTAPAPVDAQMPGPQPLYRNAAINTAWIGAHRELIEGRADPALYRRLAVQAQTTPLGLVTVLGQSYRARGLALRAEVLENNAKPPSERSVVPTFRLYLDQAQELASATVLNPAPIKRRPFVFKLSNQRGYPLVDVLTKEMPYLWGPSTLERDLTAAIKTFLRDFNETRSEPFSALSKVARHEDADFKRALAVVDLMAQMPERWQSLRDQYEKVQSQAKKLAGVYDLNLKSLGAALPESGERSVCIQYSQNNGYKVRIFDRENSYTDYSVTEPRLVDIIADKFSDSSDLKEAEFIENLASNLGHTLTEKTGLTIPEEVSNAKFPDMRPYASPPSCLSCSGDEETAENPLLTIPFDAGGHRECMAKKMVVRGWPDLKGMWDEFPALAFIELAEQANQVIEGYSRFVRLNRTPTPPPPPVQSSDSDSDSGLDSEAGWGSDDDMASASSGDSVSMSGEQASDHHVPPIPPRAPLVRQPSPPSNPDAIDQWLNERFGGRSQNSEGLGWRSQVAQSGNSSASRVESAGEQRSGEDRLSVEWGNGEAESEADGYIPLPDLEAPSDEMAMDDVRAADDDSVSVSSSEASNEDAGYRQGTRPIV